MTSRTSAAGGRRVAEAGPSRRSASPSSGGAGCTGPPSKVRQRGPGGHGRSSYGVSSVNAAPVPV
ncbi:hypothetical protein [Streptomyces sp. IMTB 2501]|uniref:hypothetical protein n=1 Tax=Streptomyces sp. IMTB 2501 TaxID=1776340 RepID=UPI002115EC51|nr:hypothetical protein [Streptomyces sp. IMTB 2501]